MNTLIFPTSLRKLLRYRRRVRVKAMLSKVVIKECMNIIDIGCGIDGRSFDDFIPAKWRVTGVDILPVDKIRHKKQNYIYIQQDARNLGQYKDNEFDLAISIGMLEHITENTLFLSVVSEIKRVARQYIVIVPFKYCWIEPHYGVPFFPIMPDSIKIALISAFNLCNHRNIIAKDPNYLKNNFMWRTNQQYKKAFGDAKIYLMPTFETIAIVRRVDTNQELE